MDSFTRQTRRRTCSPSSPSRTFRSLSPIRTPPRALFPPPYLPDLVAIAIPPSATRRATPSRSRVAAAPPSRSGVAAAPRQVVAALSRGGLPRSGEEIRWGDWLALDWSAGWLVGGEIHHSFVGELALFFRNQRPPVFETLGPPPGAEGAQARRCRRRDEGRDDPRGRDHALAAFPLAV